MGGIIRAAQHVRALIPERPELQDHLGAQRVNRFVPLLHLTCAETDEAVERHDGENGRAMGNNRITSYNVCYTKLLRDRRRRRGGHDERQRIVRVRAFSRRSDRTRVRGDIPAGSVSQPDRSSYNFV